MVTQLRIALVILIFYLTPFFGTCAPLQVATSFHPLDQFIREVGGEDISVSILVDSGADPHVFELKPSHMRLVASSDLLLLLGLGIEFWAEGIAERYAEKIHYLYPNPSDVGRESDYFDQHVWLDPQRVREMTDKIRDLLCEVRPVSCRAFFDRSQKFLHTLELFDLETRSEILRWEVKRFIALHPAWGHFARRYGLDQGGGIRERHDDEPSVKEVADLLKFARSQSINIVFVESDSAKEQVRALLSGSHVRIVEVDPLGRAGRDYFDYMCENVSRMAVAMRKG